MSRLRAQTTCLWSGIVVIIIILFVMKHITYDICIWYYTDRNNRAKKHLRRSKITNISSNAIGTQNYTHLTFKTTIGEKFRNFTELYNGHGTL